MNSANLAVTAAYLTIGFEEAALEDRRGEAYEAWSEEGHIECIESLVDHANYLETWLSDTDKKEFPGVFHYEFTIPLGRWLYANGPMEQEPFRDLLAKRWKEWIDDSRRPTPV